MLIFKKYTAMTIAGILCLFAEVVTLAPTSFMLTKPWYQYQAISNIKRFLLGCASRNCFLGAFLFISYPYNPHEDFHIHPMRSQPAQKTDKTSDGNGEVSPLPYFYPIRFFTSTFQTTIANQVLQFLYHFTSDFLRSLPSA